VGAGVGTRVEGDGATAVGEALGDGLGEVLGEGVDEPHPETRMTVASNAEAQPRTP
jgi:hypothetical protein